MSWKKITGIVGLLILFILLVLHFWITYHAEYLLKKVITSQSNGTLLFDADQVKVDYLNGRVEFRNSSLNSVEKNNETKNTYHIECKELVLQLKDILPLISGKHLSIDSVIIKSPQVVLMKREEERQQVQHVNLAAEWGTIYNGLIKTVNLFYVSKLSIADASFKMVDVNKTKNAPIEISGINLLVNQLYAGKENADRPVITVKEIELTLGREKIILPGNKKEIGFKHFSINTASGLVKLDSCSVISRSNEDSSEIDIFTDSLSIHQIDFAQLYQTGNIKASRIQLSKPLVKLSLHPRAVSNQTTEQKSLQEVIAGFNTNLSIDELLVNDARTNIVTVAEGKTNHFMVNEVNFYVSGLKAGTIAANNSLLSYDSLDLSVKNHQGTTEDSAFIFKNGLFHFTNEQLLIEDLVLSPNNRKNSSAVKSIKVKKILIDGVKIKDLLFYNRFSAKSIRVYEPDIKLVKTTVASSKKNSRDETAALNKLLKVNNLFMVNGKLDYTDNKGTSVRVSQINSNTKLYGILNSKDANDLLGKMQQFGFGDAVIQSPAGNIHLQHARLIPGSASLTIKKVFLQLVNPTIKANLENVLAAVTPPGEKSQLLKIKNIGWSKGFVQVSVTGKQQLKESSEKPLNISAEKIHFENTQLEYNNGKQVIQTFVKNLMVNDLEIVPGEKPTIKDVLLLAEQTSIKDSLLDISIASINIPGRNQFNFSGIQLQQADSNRALTVSIPSLQVNADINQLAGGDYNFDQVLLDQPAFSVLLKNAGNSTKQVDRAGKIPLIKVKQFEIKNATGSIVSAKEKQLVNLDINGLSLSAEDASITTNNVSILSNQLKTDNIIFRKDSASLFEGGVDIKGHQFLMQDSNWNYLCDEVGVHHATVNLGNKDSGSTKLNLNKLALKKLSLSSANIKNIQALLQDNNNAGIDANGIAVQIPGENITIKNIRAAEIDKDIQLDSVRVNSSLSRESFIEQSPWQTDDIRVSAAQVNLKNWRMDSWIRDSTISLAGIRVDGPFIDVYRDKNKPFQQGIIKPLPTTSLKAAPVRFLVDSINVSNGHVLYNEKSEQTQLTGKVEFTGLKAKLLNVKNINLTNADSLRLTASARFMGKALVKVRIDESYADSLAGFLFAAYLSPTPLDILNDITQPTASVKIESGNVDTMYMHAIAREYISLGMMHMPYRNLKVKFLNKGVEDDKDLLSGLITFAANTFVIKHNNKKRKGVIYFPRLREEGIFNYLAKMFLSGAASSVGAKTNKSYLRQYKRALKKNQLPPIRQIEE